jgi:tetratricopeptide (TPR) repeat protein
VVVGAIGLLLMVRTTLRQASDTSRLAVPVSVRLPEYDVQGKDLNRSGQGAIRSRLTTNVPGDIRMQSLLSLQAVPSRVSNPILENLLGDSTDDVRLVAFGMLDSEEKKISVLIQRERAYLNTDLTLEQRHTCLRHLAELHWGLTYAALAQGELRAHILSQARSFLEAAIAVDVLLTSGLFFLKARILLAQGDLESAEQALLQALDMGQSKISALPYLAEMAFKRREFERVQQLMQQLVELNVASRVRAIADFWTGNDTVSNFSDRRFKPHI